MEIMKTIIHVNQHHIKHNRKNKDEQKPVLSIITYKGTIHANEVKIDGPAVIKYSPDNPLNCGAHCWLETQSSVNITK